MVQQQQISDIIVTENKYTVGAKSFNTPVIKVYVNSTKKVFPLDLRHKQKDCLSFCSFTWCWYSYVLPKVWVIINRPYAYDVTEEHPRVLGVKRGTATCAIAKHAASGPTPACHTAGPAPGPRTDWEAESTNALPAQHVRAARQVLTPNITHGVVVMETWRQCIRSIVNRWRFIMISSILWKDLDKRFCTLDRQNNANPQS